NDPAIFAWELANEPRCVGSGTGAGGFPPSATCTDSSSQPSNTNDVTSWIHDMAALVKSQDPNHLLGVGDEGFFCAANQTDFVENCSQGTDPATYAADPNIDYVGAHLYPDFW